MLELISFKNFNNKQHYAGFQHEFKIILIVNLELPKQLHLKPARSNYRPLWLSSSSFRIVNPQQLRGSMLGQELSCGEVLQLTKVMPVVLPRHA